MDPTNMSLPARRTKLRLMIWIGLLVLAGASAGAWYLHWHCVFGFGSIRFDRTGRCEVEVMFEDGMPASFAPFCLMGNLSGGPELVLPLAPGFDFFTGVDEVQDRDDLRRSALENYRSRRHLEVIPYFPIDAPYITWPTWSPGSYPRAVLTNESGRFVCGRPSTSSPVRVLPFDIVADTYRLHGMAGHAPSDGRLLLAHLEGLARTFKCTSSSGNTGIVLPLSTPHIEMTRVKLGYRDRRWIALTLQVVGQVEGADHGTVGRESVNLSILLPKDVDTLRIPILLDRNGWDEDTLYKDEVLLRFQIGCDDVPVFLGNDGAADPWRREVFRPGLIWRGDLDQILNSERQKDSR